MNNIFSVSTTGGGCCKPLMSFQPALMDMDSLFHHHRKEKVVVIMGATGTGKSKLAIDIATHFPPAEVINSDKMQVYKGLDITTNKVTEEERRGVPHHLLGTIDNPKYNFTAKDFCEEASLAIGSIVGRDGLPIIAGGSNSFIEALVSHDPEFRLRYECCFLWVDVSLPVLHSSLSARVDRMIEAGQVEEVRQFFELADDDDEYYRGGIRRAIGVPEFDELFRAAELEGNERRCMKRLLEGAINALKVNNCKLANRQVQKIHRLYGMWKRNMHRLDATEVFVKSGRNKEEVWEEHVLAKGRRIVQKFLYEENLVGNGIVPAATAPAAAVRT